MCECDNVIQRGYVMFAVRLKLCTQKSKFDEGPKLCNSAVSSGTQNVEFIQFSTVPYWKVYKGTKIGMESSLFWGHRCHRAVQILFALSVLCTTQFHYAMPSSYVTLFWVLICLARIFQMGLLRFRYCWADKKWQKGSAHEAPDWGSEHQKTDESLIY